MGVIEEVYGGLETDVSLEEFRTAVQAKVEEMAGLADDETAAMLLAHELQDGTVSTIEDVEVGMEEVEFLAKVRRIGELRTFERDDEEEGHVLNVEAVDETGSVRLAFWDERATAIDAGEVEEGEVIRVKGRPREGYGGLEVSVIHAEVDPEASLDVDLDAGHPIDTLSVGQQGVSVRGVVLDTEPVRTFERDDGSEGRVANLMLGDETGRIRVTLWDDRASEIADVESGDRLEILEGSIRERDGTPECHVGERGKLEPTDQDVSFVPDPDPITDLAEGDVADIAGVVRSTDPVREFERDDGSTGRVRNVRIQDGTGDVRVAIWGENADLELAPGDTVWFGDVEIRDGWQDDIEASVSWRSSIAPIDSEHVRAEASESGPRTTEDGSAQLEAFAEKETREPEAAEPITFTGTVVQTGDPLIVDDGEEALRVETDSSVTLGQRVTVEGTRRGNRIEAERIESG